jgi:signal transduction histidine kinase
MDFLTKFKRQVAVRSFIYMILPMLAALVVWYVSSEILNVSILLSAIFSLTSGLIFALLGTIILVDRTTKPLGVLESIITYTAHSERSTHPEPIESLKIGRELITAQSLQIYDLASSQQPEAQTTTPNQVNASPLSGTKNTLLDGVPLPVIGMDSNQNVTLMNKAAGDYLGLLATNQIGKSINDTLKLFFQEDETLNTWLDKTKSSAVTATRSWDSVRHVIDDDNYKQFDMAVSFSSGNQSGTETMIAIFDHTVRYSQEDKDISFVALAVHELRTPLTIMRGYIEVFEDELGDTLPPELADFMHKMHASSERLTAFVSNILNVARLEENQLSLKLKSENWKEIIQSAVEDLQLRARVHNIELELTVAENLPQVAVDRISMHEVINNLIDNAIKYSGASKRIVINSQANSQGLIETSIQDFGIGIPESVINQLFQKYHRSHRSSTQISGTGLGLYLCKALVSAHGGNIWVRSKEGQGSIFTFTIIPYDQISKEQAAGEDGIIRGAHGWIKNHSLYRN